MKPIFLAALTVLCAIPFLQARDLPLADERLVSEESDGLVVVEAEHFYQQEKDGVRAWHLTTKDRTPDLKPDADPNHTAGASGGAYLEILPDTRKNHGEKLIKGENFINEPGKMAVISYKVHFNKPGKYYVWARVHSTGTEDNGLHVGIDGTWPESGQRMQWTGKRQWIWNSKQRTEEQHGGVRGLLFLNVDRPGEHTIHFSMREDGFEFDQWLMTTDPDFAVPKGPVKISDAKAGKIPEPFPIVAAPKTTADPPVSAAPKNAASSKAQVSNIPIFMAPADFTKRERLYVDGKWLAVDPKKDRGGKATGAWPFNEGTFDLTLHAVGENDGESTYEIFVEGESVGKFTTPLSQQTTEEGKRFSKTFENVLIPSEAAMIEVVTKVGTKDDENHSRARWSGIEVAVTDGKKVVRKRGKAGVAPVIAASRPAPKPSFTGELFGERGEDGSGEVTVSGELKKWHKVTLTLEGPWAHEKDNAPNPFTDYRFFVIFTHESDKHWLVPGYFAADGKAGETSAESGNQWRAHFAPGLTGKWQYLVSFTKGPMAALSRKATGDELAPFSGVTGSFTIAESAKKGRDFRAHGRLNYARKHHLEFAETGRPFLKAGADAPETFLGYADFDGTIANKPDKVPLKTWKPHLRDWRPGDPTWQDGKGKGMIGAINYLSGKGCNVFSFLPYNAGGDGDNVWPFVERNDKLNYDCSKLDQWGIVFDHATAKGMFLHFKLQETEMDDNIRGGHKGGSSKGKVPTALDGGDLGPERMLYCRELVARYGHNLGLNWNLGEENTQTTQQQKDMAQYLHDIDPYNHLIVVHTFPNQQDKVYLPLLGENSALRGASLQNSNVKDCHSQIVKWTRASDEAGVPWVVSFDEPGNASEGMPADPGYPGMPDNFDNPSIHTTRKQVLWGTLLGGGGGVEYYFGYKLPQNDLICEDWRSRDRSWDYCNIALSFFRDHEIPLNEMSCQDELVGNPKHDNSAYCFAKPGELYLVYLPEGGKRDLDLGDASGEFSVQWFNPRDGGELQDGVSVKAGGKVSLTAPDAKDDWLGVVRKQ